jgi:hypothetical protein
MTFTEAAVEVLRLVGKPLHYKKITEVAIERSLLSHVGKTPEVTMSSRLATMVKRDRGDAPIIKVKPGVFGLRDFSVEQLSDLSGDVDELPEVEVESEQNKTDETEAALAEAPKPRVEAKRPLPGADVFPEEADDDEPILGSPEEEDDDEEDEESSAEAGSDSAAGESRSARRRRKRRRRGGEEAEEPRPAREPQRTAAPEVRENQGRGGRGNDRERSDRNPRDRDRTAQTRDRNDRERNDRERNDRERNDRERNDRDRNDRERDRDRNDRERNDRERHDRDRDVPGDLHREAADGDLLGKDLADAVASVLSQSSPRGLSALRIADMLVRRGRLQGDPQQLVPTVMAAVRADVARSQVERARPRFRVEGGAVVLTDLLLPPDVVRAEQDVLRAAERQRDRARRAFLRRVADLPGAGLAELVATWLNGEGVVGLRAVRRPMAGPGELHLAGTLRRGVEEVRLAIIVCRDSRELGRERVVEARGALHYYGGATSAWVITLGNVMSGAREEAQAPATAPVSLYDGMALAAAMERVGVGLVTQHVAVSALDFELLDALRGPAPRERDDRDERGRDERSERSRDDRNERGRDRDERRRERDDRRNDRGNDRGRERDDNVAARDEGDDLEQDLRSDAEDVGDDAGTAQAGARSAEALGAVRGPQPAAPGEGRRRKRRRRRKGRGDGREPDAVPGVAVEGGDDDADEAYAEGDEEREEGDAERSREEAGFEGDGPYAEDERGDDRVRDQDDDLSTEEGAEGAAEGYLDEPYEDRENDESEADEDSDEAELEDADLQEGDLDEQDGDRPERDDDHDDDDDRR